MKKMISAVIFAATLATTSSFASKNNFQFQINEYHTKRQAGQTLDIYVRYAMKDDIDYADYPDYRALRTIALKYLEPSEDLPTNTFWEVIAAKIGNDLLSKYPFSGISVQLLVHSNENGSIPEPGNHGPIYTIGDVIPLSEVGGKNV